MNTKILAGLVSGLCLASNSLLLAADDPTLVGDQARAARDTLKENAKTIADATKQGVEQATNTARDVAHEVAASTREGAEQVTNTAKNGSERVKAAVQKNAKPTKTVAPADTPLAKTPG